MTFDPQTGTNTISLNSPYTNYAETSQTGAVEIWQIDLDTGESFAVNHLEADIKDQMTDSSFTVEVFDQTNSSVLASTSDKVTGKPVGQSGAGSVVVLRFENLTGESKPVAINMIGERQ